MKRALIAKMPATTSATAMTTRRRRSTITSSLTAAQRRDGGSRRRTRRGLGRRRAPGGVALDRRARGAVATAQRGERQIGQHAAPAFGGLVDDHLGAVLEHLFHGLEVEPLESDLLRRLEGVVDRGEATGVTLGAGDDLLAVGFRLLLDRCRRA